MKKLILALLYISIITSCSQKSQYVIIQSEEADLNTQLATQQLQKYWFKIFNEEITIEEKTTGKQIPIFIGKEFINETHKEKFSTLVKDGFLISVAPDKIILAGKESMGDRYAVSTFLEEQIGCIKLSHYEEYIPQYKSHEFKHIEKFYEPAFDFRRVFMPGPRESEDFRNWYKLHEIDDWGMFVHTFHQLIPPEKYFDDHPEYFSLVNGRRLQDAQLCLSNPEVISLLIENLSLEIKKQPHKTYWSVSQNDAYNYCECKECQKKYEFYGNVSGIYIEMANAIAKAFPEKQISTLAYQFTRSAPKNINPLPNVNIMFCSIECNRSQALDKDPRSHSFVKDMKDWTMLTSNIFIWDYVVQFKNYLTPFPNFHVLQPNIKFFRDHGVKMMFQQGSSKTWSDLAELKQYLIAKLLWNPDINVDSLSHLFIDHYYGPAAPYIEEYHYLTSQELQKSAIDEFLNIYGYPGNYTDSYLRPELMLYYDSLMNLAEESVISDEILSDRVKRCRLPVDFAWVDISINNLFDEMPAIIENEINPIILEKLHNLNTYASTHANIVINERQFFLEEYKNYAMNKLDLMRKENLLITEDCHIEILSNYSDTYPVGGARALHDRLFGTLSFSENWLGFHGEDMLVNIDFEKPQSISQINMNFLKAVNSWVFLPKEIVIEGSSNGRDFKPIETVTNDLSDQNYLVKSVPFQFNFDEQELVSLKIYANSIKECPEWHRGFGKASWIFIDEIVVN